MYIVYLNSYAVFKDYASLAMIGHVRGTWQTQHKCLSSRRWASDDRAKVMPRNKANPLERVKNDKTEVK